MEVNCASISAHSGKIFVVNLDAGCECCSSKTSCREHGLLQDRQELYHSGTSAKVTMQQCCRRGTTTICSSNAKLCKQKLGVNIGCARPENLSLDHQSSCPGRPCLRGVVGVHHPRPSKWIPKLMQTLLDCLAGQQESRAQALSMYTVLMVNDPATSPPVAILARYRTQCRSAP